LRAAALIGIALSLTTWECVGAQLPYTKPTDVVFHRNIAEHDREIICDAVLMAIDSILLPWIGPAHQPIRPSLRGVVQPPQSPHHQPFLDPRVFVIRDSFPGLYRPPGELDFPLGTLSEPLDSLWVIRKIKDGLIAGVCTPRSDWPCDSGPGRLAVAITSISPLPGDTVTVGLMFGIPGDSQSEGAAAHWLVRLRRVGGAWHVIKAALVMVT
jgi:hypothetical protein